MDDLAKQKSTVLEGVVPNLRLSDKATTDRPLEIFGFKLAEEFSRSNVRLYSGMEGWRIGIYGATDAIPSLNKFLAHGCYEIIVRTKRMS